MKSDKDELQAAWEALQPNGSEEPAPTVVEVPLEPEAKLLPPPPPIPLGSPRLIDMGLTRRPPVLTRRNQVSWYVDLSRTTSSFLDWILDMERLFTVLLFFVLFTATGGLFWVCWRAISADGKVTSCYVEVQGGNGFSHDTYYVKGNIDWRPDVSMASYPTSEAALEGLKHLCP